jgi:hypothetical protein
MLHLFFKNKLFNGIIILLKVVRLTNVDAKFMAYCSSVEKLQVCDPKFFSS